MKEKDINGKRHEKVLDTNFPELAKATSELYQREQEAWENILGTSVEVKPLPNTITPEVRRNLDIMGFDLRYVPALGLGKWFSLRIKGEERYLVELQRQYPNWKRFESLNRAKDVDEHSISRNLDVYYWSSVKDGKVEFPLLPGQWMAVETVDKPRFGREYQKTPLTEKLGFRDYRFLVSWNDAHKAIEREKPTILSEIGLTGRTADLRLLEAIEWNLLGNREGWGKSSTYEWTNTEYRVPGDPNRLEWVNTGYREAGNSNRLVVGGSDDGGAASVLWVHPDARCSSFGFRAAVVLGS